MKLSVVVKIVTVVLLVFGVGTYIYLNYYTNYAARLLQDVGFVRPNEAPLPYYVEAATGVLPSELTDKVDPTRDSVVFRVESVDAKMGYFHLMGMQSAGLLAGVHITTKVACPFWDLLMQLPDGTENYILASNLMKTIGQLDNKDVFVSGICKDMTCNVINSHCVVTVL